jgi:hypothetical protein
LEALEQIKEEIRKKIAAERKSRRLNGQPYPIQQPPTGTFDPAGGSLGGMNTGGAATMSQASAMSSD